MTTTADPAALHILAHMPPLPASPPPLIRGDLVLHYSTKRAYWRNTQLPLSLTEFELLARLAATPGQDLDWKYLYEVLRGPGFFVGHNSDDSSDGVRANVRSHIKRIRRKFVAIDPEFNRIVTYSNFGYHWATEEEIVLSNS